MAFQFRTGYVLHYNQIHGKRMVNVNPVDTAKRYLKSYFIIDVLAILPLPQFAVIVIISDLDGSTPFLKKNLLKFIIISQYVPRVINAFLLYKKVIKVSGFFTEKAWTGAAFNFYLYVLASHVHM
ncbi:hypothetical protein L1987_63046 [Smallanthus sonchifolius]|uniref:Uncharacterized protein n=1 Tax=Smallanthus sonchifolius TaxID=185202 RepID=A0ACB9CC86_9ASTR|nr:hypothetical protein L1987_63046 [Smallanthus sonchifolius]